jgi:hypothetical protein
MTLSRVNNTVIRWGAVAPGLTGASWVVMRQIISNDTPPGITDAEHPRNERFSIVTFQPECVKKFSNTLL